MTDLFAIFVTLGALPLFLVSSYMEAMCYMSLFNAFALVLWLADRSCIPRGLISASVKTKPTWTLGQAQEYELTLLSEAVLPQRIDIVQSLPTEVTAGEPVEVTLARDFSRPPVPGAELKGPIFKEVDRRAIEDLTLDALQVGLGGGTELPGQRRRLRREPADLVPVEFPELPVPVGGGGRRLTAPLALVPQRLDLIPGEELHLVQSLTPGRLGRILPGRVHVRIHGPLGFSYRQETLELGEPIDVVPALDASVPLGAMDARPPVGDAGLLPSRARGSGQELHSLRPYAPGDGLRKIAWKASGRRGRMIVRDNVEEVGQQLMILLDVGRTAGIQIAGGGPSDRLERGISLASSLMRASLGQGDRVGFMAFAEGVETFVKPAKGKRQWEKILAEIRPLRTSTRPTSFKEAVTHFLTCVRRRTVVVVITDVPQEDLESLRTLSAKHQLTVLTQRDAALGALSSAPCDEPSEGFQRSAAAQLEVERQAAIDELRREGLRVLDVDPTRFTLKHLGSPGW